MAIPKIPTQELEGGVNIPILAFGTGTSWYKPDRFSAFNHEMVNMTGEAINAGYRHLDTAEGYGTEAEMGQAIKASGVPRGELFIVSKGINTLSEGSIDDLPLSVENTLKRLQLDYLDLYLLHSPYIKDNTYSEADVARTWGLLESIQRSGKIRAIGVSNFRKEHVQNLLKTAVIKPVINQIQFHPYLKGAPEYAKWLQSQGIAVAGWMGLAPITHLKGLHLTDTLKALKEKYNVSESTILIRWQLDQGIVVLNTTKKVERFQEFFASLDLKLSEEDATTITRIGEQNHVRVPVGNLFDGGDYTPY